jgi:hypothetical protein
LFDLSQGGRISYHELGILIVTVATSVERVRGTHTPDAATPLSNEKVDTLAKMAMSHLHKVIESGTSAVEFQDWVQNGLKLPIASNGVNLNLLAEALMIEVFATNCSVPDILRECLIHSGATPTPYNINIVHVHGYYMTILYMVDLSTF